MSTGRGAVFSRFLCLVSVILLAYLALLLHPEFLLSHEIREENLILHSSEKLPPEARSLAREALVHLKASELYRREHKYHVFLCASPGEYAVFARWNRSTGGISMVGLTGHVFLRPSNIRKDRLIGASGIEVPGERRLTYFVVHEVTHTMTARYLGRIRYFRLSTWQQEGYADFIAKAGHFEFEATLSKYRAGDGDLNPQFSGLYLKYQLMFEFLLRSTNKSESALLSSPLNGLQVEEQLRALKH